MDLPFEESETLASAVLVVDDEVSVLQVFVRLLARDQDVSVSTAQSAEAALVLLTESRFDLLITDKNLPGMGGVELIAAAQRLRPTLEAVMITGYASAQSLIAALAAGASDYLVKPFDEISVVRAKVHAALDRRNKRVKGHEQSHRLAREASQLLAKGKAGASPSWDRLELQVAAYELAIRSGSKGQVFVVGSQSAATQLKLAGVEAAFAPAWDTRLEQANVVVIDTALPQWRELVERLTPARPELLLIAGESQDLADLLEAISLRLELVPIDIPGRLSAHVRGLLMRQAVQQAQQSLAIAVADFRNALGG